jgi:predicted enzyme related to lactoylglutathione lyase
MRATVSRFEIPVREAVRAARFYRQAFGWTIEPIAWEGPAYLWVGAAAPAPSVPAREGIDGGLTTAGLDGVDHPLLVIHVDGVTLEECLERIAAAGGAIDLPVTQVGTLGRFARFRDTEGNRLGLWQKL